MIVYGSSLSPFVRKLLVVADEKGLVMEVEPTAPNSNDPAFREASPFGKIPGFRHLRFHRHHLLSGGAQARAGHGAARA
jgi:glutathione S-transferase